MTVATSSSIAALARFIRPERTGPRCELCSEPIGEDHSHLVEVSTRQLFCGCYACARLFPERPGARYRNLPERPRAVPGLDFDGGRWEGLGVPVGVAFFMRSSSARAVIALYPSPAGTVESSVSPEAWEALESTSETLRGLETDVEALVVWRSRSAAWIAPIDRCYGLAGRVRSVWSGLSGGPRVDEAVAEFFARMTSEAGP